MYFLDGRISRIVNELRSLMYVESREINDTQIRYGEVPKPIDWSALTDGWQTYQSGTAWTDSAADTYALFKTKINVPDEFAGRKVILAIRTNRSGWNAVNPQMLLYIDGKEQQGLDTNHTEAVIDDSAERGKVYEITIYAFSGVTRNENRGTDDTGKVKLFLELKVVDPLIEELYYNLKIPQMLSAELAEGSADRAKLTNILNDTINKLDLRSPYSQEFSATVEEANHYIKEQLYAKPHGQDAVVTCIGHTHIDVAWLWRYCHTREKAVRSFSTVLKLMDQYPEFVFMSSQPQLYEYIKEDHPQVFEIIKQRVQEGRWEPEGGMWVEPDTNIPSGESLVRQFLFGTRFFKQEFDVENKILWLPDVFGFNGNLPQIMKKSGIEYFMTAKLAYNEFNKIPQQTFVWRGIDGSEVLAHQIVNLRRGYNGQADAEDVVQMWNKYTQKDINDDILLAFGYGDGGGGPVKEMLESIRRYHNGLPGSPRAKTGRAREFFERLNGKVRNSPRLPQWVGELYFEWHRGTYTSMARNKKYNRKAEFLYTSAEWVSSFISLLFGEGYPHEELNSGWKGILLNQFHDVLPGSAVKQVYEDSDQIYHTLFTTGNKVLNAGFDRLTSSIKADSPSLVVFNSLSWERTGVVEFAYPSDQELLYLEDRQGKTSVCQKTDSGENTYLSIVGGVFPKGYSSFVIVETQGHRTLPGSDMHISTNLLENRFYRMCLDDQGLITSLFDKQANHEVLKVGERGNVLQAFEDKPMLDPYWGGNCDNWNLDIFYSEKMWEINDVESIEVIEDGPVRGILRIKRRFLSSVITQDIILYCDIPRVDFRTIIDWKEKDILVKAAFPVNINSDRATYEIQYGHIERDTHWNTSWDVARFEVCGHKWADLSEDGYGVSLLNDCKYGYDIKDGRMRLSLLRCGTVPNVDADREVHEFTYSLYPHLEGWREGRTVQQAYDLNCPLIGQVVEKQAGSIPESMSMVRVDRDNVIVEVVKRAEDGDELIIRAYEAYNRRSTVRLSLCSSVKRVVECNLMESEYVVDEVAENKVNHEGNEIFFTINPLELKTLKVTIL